MKRIIKIFLAFILTTQSPFVYANEGGPSDPQSGETESPIDEWDNEVCDHCIPLDATAGQVYEINGEQWRLDYLMDNGMWVGVVINNDTDSTYDGKSADETFGRDEYSLPNPSRVRWMNAGYDPLDEELQGPGIDPVASERLRSKIFEHTTKEALEVVNTAKQNLIDSTGSKNGFICPDLECSEKLDKFSSLSFITKPSKEETPDGFMSDFFEKIPNEAPFVSDEVGASGQYLDQQPYLSERKDELNELRDKLNQHRSQSPQQWDAKTEAYQQLRNSDSAYVDKDKDEGDAHFKVAEFLVDIATDVVPVTSIPKDLYRAFVGKDPLTGEGLSPFERVLSAGFAGLDVVTAGGFGAVAAGIKVIGKAARATEKEANLAEKLAEILAKSPLKVEVLVHGTTEGFTVIGRDMTRVNEVSAALGAHGIEVNTLNSFSKEAREQWKDLLLKFGSEPGGRIPPEAVKESLMFAENQKWIRDALEKGHTILDLGDPLKREISAFYEMEKTEIMEFLKRRSK